MTSDLERRVMRLEGDVGQLQQQVASLLQQAAALKQQVGNAGGGGGGGGSSTGYLGCVIGSNLTHGSSLTGQTIYQVNPAGTRVNLSTNATVYNDGPNAADDITAASTVFLMPNPDGTYTVIGVYC